MTNLIPFTGNSQQAPQQERLGSVEVPIIRSELGVIDGAVHDLYAQVIRMPLSRTAVEATTAAPTTANDPIMAQLARDAMNFAYNPSNTGANDVQEAA